MLCLFLNFQNASAPTFGNNFAKISEKCVLADLHLVPEKVQAQTGTEGCTFPAHNPRYP